MALSAHDKKTLELALFALGHREVLPRFHLVATGGILHQRTGLAVERVLAVFFFRDPLTAQPHEPDVSALARWCDVHDVPLATNPAGAQALMPWLRQQVKAGAVEG